MAGNTSSPRGPTPWRLFAVNMGVLLIWVVVAPPISMLIEWATNYGTFSASGYYVRGPSTGWILAIYFLQGIPFLILTACMDAVFWIRRSGSAQPTTRDMGLLHLVFRNLRGFVLVALVFSLVSILAAVVWQWEPPTMELWHVAFFLDGMSILLWIALLYLPAKLLVRMASTPSVSRGRKLASVMVSVGFFAITSSTPGFALLALGTSVFPAEEWFLDSSAFSPPDRVYRPTTSPDAELVRVPTEVEMKERERRARSVVTNLLGIPVEELTYESTFVEDLGADWRDTAELVMAIEREFDCEILDEEAEQIATFGGLVDYLRYHCLDPLE